MTIFRDRWIVARDGQLVEYAPGDLAGKIVEDILEQTIPSPTL
jgi:hypothetical protein